MNILKPISICHWTVLALAASSVQLSYSAELLPATSFIVGQSTLSVAEKNILSQDKTSWKVSARQNEGMMNRSLRDKKSHVENMGIGISRKQILSQDDQASFTLYAPTSDVNRLLSYINRISDSDMDSAWVTLMQALSLSENKQVNSEFTYTVPITKGSNFDTAVRYQLQSGTDSGQSSMAASFRYSGKF